MGMGTKSSSPAHDKLIIFFNLRSENFLNATLLLQLIRRYRMSARHSSGLEQLKQAVIGIEKTTVFVKNTLFRVKLDFSNNLVLLLKWTKFGRKESYVTNYKMKYFGFK